MHFGWMSPAISAQLGPLAETESHSRCQFAAPVNRIENGDRPTRVLRATGSLKRIQTLLIKSDIRSSGALLYFQCWTQTEHTVIGH